MNITLRLSTQSIDDAIKQVQEFRQRFLRHMEELCKRLAEEGMEVMELEYGRALYAGINDIEVSVDAQGESAYIIAKGERVAFIEFGTGVRYAESPHGAKAGIPPRGSYGKHKGATGKPWIYKGEPGNLGSKVKGKPGYYWSIGNPAASAIPAAMIYMQNRIMDIAREVFDDD